MCRLAYIPGHSKVKKADLKLLFQKLQTAFGGDGNGFAVHNSGSFTVKKGVKLETEDIANEVYNYIRSGMSVYFHTRKISVGWSSDAQCHPFRIQGKYWNGTLCHNGTWYDGGTLAKYFQKGSDTATLAYLIGKIGIQGLKNRGLWPSSGIFLLSGGTPGESSLDRAIAISGDLKYCPVTGIWASEFGPWWPTYNKVYSVGLGEHMLDKQPPKRTQVVSSSYSAKSYYGNSAYNYGQKSYKETLDDHGLTEETASIWESGGDKKWDERSVQDDEKAWDEYWQRKPIHSRYEDPDPMEDDDYVTGGKDLPRIGYHL